MKNKLLVIAAAMLILIAAVIPAAALNEECGACHTQRVTDLAASAHYELACESCHENAANHGGNMAQKTTVHFDLEVCGGCHPDQYNTYKYGDSYATKYGGSPSGVTKTNPTNGFTSYNTIIDGQGFVKEYNEERGHDVMLLDHKDVTRGKFETCMQCKSTKIAYFWDAKNADGSRKELVVENETPVTSGHMKDALGNLVVYTVPKGTKVSMYTDRVYPLPGGTKPSHEARVLVTLPNGTVYKSYDLAALDATTRDLNLRWTWATLYALTVNELTSDSPTRASGNGCNHCHNPHKVGRDQTTGGLLGFRLIRKSEIDAIERAKYDGNGKLQGGGGLNPYNADSPSGPGAADLENAPLTLDGGIALCGQCHVEYVCGKSSIDNIDRDFFPWAKVGDLEEIYSTNFHPLGTTPQGTKYVMDWKHGIGMRPWQSADPGQPGYYPPGALYPIGEALIKSQHPEAETYWNSRHYFNDAACYTCHMPKVTKTSGGAYTSHWIASPIKYMSTASVGPFATTFGLKVDKSGIISPCGACHGGLLARMKDKAISKQDSTYASALTVETALVASLKAINAAKLIPTANTTLIAAAVEDHRAAHVRWENLVVSENSMGFHNPTEIDGELSIALSLANSAKQKAVSSVGAPPPPVCSSYTTRATCQAAGCSWSSKTGTCK